MHSTARSLPEPCASYIASETLRKQLLAHGLPYLALLSYFSQSSFIADKNTAGFWDAEFEKSTITHPMEEWRLSCVKKHLNFYKSILNIGVGAARLERRYYEQFSRAQYVGTDITTHTLDKLRTELPALEFKKLQIGDSAEKIGQFDQVLLLEVVEHLYPVYALRMLQLVQRCLKPGGTCILSIPVNEGLEQMLPDNPNGHLRMYNLPLIKMELLASGFVIKKIYSAAAFHRFFSFKHAVNTVLSLRKPNNLVLVCQKK